MSRKRFDNGQNNQGGGGAPAWMVTFSDLMSLLLTFFILLYSMSDVDAQKFKEVSESLHGVLSGMGYPNVIEGELPSGNGSSDIDLEGILDTDSEILEMQSKVSKYITEEELEAEVSVSVDKRGVFVDIKEAILFDPGSAIIKDSGQDVLNKLRGLIGEFDNDLVIEGHTDDVPMNTPQYPSNWELSTARAVSVLRHFIEVEGVEPNRLSAVGYGEYRPMVPNSSPKNREANRRVNILIVIEDEHDRMGDDGGE